MSDIAEDSTTTPIPSADDSTHAETSSNPEKAVTVGETLEFVQHGLGVYTSASRSILLHICQRLARLEAQMGEVRRDVYQLRSETHQGSETVRGEVSGVFDQVNSMTSKLKEYENVMEVFQNDIRTNQNHLSVLSTKVKKETENIKVVDTVRSSFIEFTYDLTNFLYQKVEDHRQDFNNRFVELTQKFQELPLQLAALQPAAPPPSHIPEKFTFQTNDEKLSLQTHLQRLDGTKRSKGYTDLQPFTIPDDMRLKVEKRIRQQEASKREADARAAAELSEAYRRLQLAAINSNNPRLSEIHLTLDQCQQEVKRAFQLIRTTNLELYSYCESKAERMEITGLQNEIKQLRSRLRDVESSSVHRSKQPPLQFGGDINGNTLDLMVGDNSPAPSMKKGPQHLTSSQIPVLRVSLLELSRNLNLLKHRWKKHNRLHSNSIAGVNPVALKHLEKLVSLINDAYSTMAQEPIDLAAAEAHVEKVGRVLGSDFSMQILALLGGRSDEPERCRFPVAITARAAAGEMAAALCKYSEAFTDMFFRREADNKVATAAMNEWASEKRTLENVGREVSALARSQHVLEVTLAKLAVALQRKSDSDIHGESTDNKSEADILHSWTTLGEDLQHLKGQVEAMSKQFVTEETLAELLKQNMSFPGVSGVSVGHRSGGPDSPLAASLLKRPLSVENDSNKMLAAITLEPHEDRKSQTKLDPIQVVKMNGSTRHLPRNEAGEHFGSATQRMQNRAQMLRPKSVHRDR
ncbi:hypothetical protein DVH05_013718 [Phytophthora capsici]|nr:hypothetical protein DVH05_013718 [Phytophthora capsici]